MKFAASSSPQAIRLIPVAVHPGEEGAAGGAPVKHVSGRSVIVSTEGNVTIPTVGVSTFVTVEKLGTMH